MVVSVDDRWLLFCETPKKYIDFKLSQNIFFYDNLKNNWLILKVLNYLILTIIKRSAWVPVNTGISIGTLAV